MKNMRNKKADASIVLLIFMTVFVCAASLFIFFINEKNNSNFISSVYKIDDFYSKEENIAFFVYGVARDVVNKNKNIDETIFINSFKKEYYDTLLLNKDNLNSPDFFNYGSVLNTLKNEKNYDVEIKEGTLFFTLRGVEFTQDLSNMPEYSINMIKLNKNITIEMPLK